MKHYLVVFNRRSGSMVHFREFSQASEALTERFKVESEHISDRNIEVVVLGAESDSALRKTHGRYFHDAGEIADTALGKLGQEANILAQTPSTKVRRVVLINKRSSRSTFKTTKRKFQ